MSNSLDPNDAPAFGSATSILPILLICVAVFVAYSNAMTGQFLFDDRYSIVENKSIHAVWPLSQSLWGPRDMPTAGRPLVNLSFALNYSIGKLSVFGYHLVNILLHVINAVLLFTFLHWTISKSSWGTDGRNEATNLSFVVAMLWALHPMQTETVTYVTQRTELMMAMFFLLTLYTARRAWDASNPKAGYAWQILSVIACGLGMGCKEVMVVAPVMVMVYDLTVLACPTSRLIQRRWPLYLGLVATWGILASLLATNPRGSSVGVDLDVKPLEYLALQFWAIVHYFWLAIWPSKLVGDYGDFKPIAISTWLPCLLILVMLVGATFWAWFRKRPLSFLGCWIFLILAPTSSVVPIATEPIAERRMYLPLAAVMLLLVLAVAKIISRWSNDVGSQSNATKLTHRYLLGAIAIAVASIYGAATYSRNEVFQTELSFWIDVTQKLPQNSRGFSILGSAYLNENQPELALASLKHAIELEPGDSGALCNLGIWNAKQGNIAEALVYFDRSIAINPRLFDPLFNRGLIFLKQGKLDESILSFKAAIRVNPNISNLYVTLGSAQFMKNELDDAIENFRIATQIDPQSSDAFSNLGAALNRKSEFQQAIDMSHRALAIEPTKAAALHNLGDSLVGLKRADEAIDAYLQCHNATPNDIQVLLKLGKIFANQKQIANATQCFERILQLQPGSPEAIKELQQLGQE